MITFTIPIATPSASNLREHWRARHSRVKTQRLATWTACRGAYSGWLPKPMPCVVTLTRVAPRQLDDDNVRGALKAVRDELAAWLGVDDRDPRVRWEYGQERGAACVRVDVAPMAAVSLAEAVVRVTDPERYSAPEALDAALAAYGRGK